MEWLAVAFVVLTALAVFAWMLVRRIEKIREEVPAPKGVTGKWMRGYHVYARRRMVFEVTIETCLRSLSITEHDDSRVIGLMLDHRLKAMGIIPDSALLLMVDLPVDRWVVSMCYEDNSFPEVAEGCTSLTTYVDQDLIDSKKGK